jgi:hypothetical protein
MQFHASSQQQKIRGILRLSSWAGVFRMPISNLIKFAPEVSGTKPWKNLSLQDAIIVIAMYAAQVNMGAKNVKKARRIAGLAKKLSLFSDETDDVVARIFRLVDSPDMRDLPKAVDQAAKSLTPELRQTAYELAAELAVDNGILTADKQGIMEQIRTKLLIDAHTAGSIINEAVEKSKD